MKQFITPTLINLISRNQLIAVTLILLTALPVKILSQEKILWSPDVEITENSFLGTTPNLTDDNLQQYSFICTFDFSFHMSNIQFAFTKNFNKYVESYFIPSLSWLEKGELTDQLIKMANLDFDIAELFARKFRKKLYETKRIGSKVNFYNNQYNIVSSEYNNYRAEIESAMRSTDDVDSLIMEYINGSVLNQAAILPIFSTCL